MYESEDLSDDIEMVSKRYVVRTIPFQYLGKDRGDLEREGLGLLSFDLSGRITSLSRLDTLRKLFLENDSDYKKFYYPNSDKFWKVKTTGFDASEKGGELNIYPVRIRLETLDQFQYGTQVTVEATIGTADAGTVTFDLINDGNIWLEPNIQIEAVGTTISPAVMDTIGRKITWQGTISPGETLLIYPDYTAQIGTVWYSHFLDGNYPKLEVLDGGTESWTYTEDAASEHSGTASAVYRSRWW